MEICFIDATHNYALFFNIGFLKVRTICKDYGIVCIRREGQDVENMIFGDRILYENRVSITEFFFKIRCINQLSESNTVSFVG